MRCLTTTRSGSFGNHVRWHEHKGIVNPECEHCPTEHDAAASEPDFYPESGGDIGGRSGGESGQESRTVALPQPDPTPPEPDPSPNKPSSDKSDHANHLARFEEFWDTYGNKVGRKKSETAWVKAMKAGNDPDVLISSAASYADYCQRSDTFMKNPLTWLNGEHWNDERPARQAKAEPMSNVQQHLALARRLAEQEQDAQTIPFPQIGGGQR